MTSTEQHGGDEADYRPLAEINVTPLVDVMLVLLIIFMVAAPLMVVGVPVDLPQTSAAAISQPRQPVIVTVTRSGEVYLREEPVAEAALVERLAALKEEVGDAVVYVRGDRGIDYGRVLSVLGEVGQAGFAKVSLIAEAERPSPAR
jgi:TolR protein